MKRLLLTTLCITLLAPAATASANTYDVYSCWAGYGTFHNPNASSSAWTPDESASGGHFVIDETCGATSAGTVSMSSLSGLAASSGEFARLKFTAPTGLAVTHVDLWRNAWSYGSGTAQRNAVRVLAAGAPVSGGVDADGTVDVPYGTRGTTNNSEHGLLPANLLSLAPASNSVEYRVSCASSTGCPTALAGSAAPNHAASGVTLYGAQVTVQDSKLPSIIVSDGGLFTAETVAGTAPLVVESATDESGIRKLAVYADFDPNPIAVVDYEQDVNRCDWSKAAPCQNVSGVSVPVDTTQLVDGDHSFVVKAYDAADNEKASSTHYATVKNATPVDPGPTDPGPTDPGPTDPGPTDPGPTQPGGSGGDGAGLPNGIGTGTDAGAPVGGPRLSVTFDHNGKAVLNAKYGRMVVVRGHLVDGSGAGIAEAQIDYSAHVMKTGARTQNLGAVRTDGSGTFLLEVATKLGSRQLRFAYRPQLGGAVAVSAQARLDVVAPVSLTVSPKYVRNKHAVTFRGRLKAGPIPRKGKLVNMQVVVDHHWHTFATVRTTRSGRYRFRYRFKRTYGHVTYRFRARSRYEAAYPFVAGSSRTVRVHVNPCPCE